MEKREIEYIQLAFLRSMLTVGQHLEITIEPVDNGFIVIVALDDGKLILCTNEDHKKPRVFKRIETASNMIGELGVSQITLITKVA